MVPDRPCGMKTTSNTSTPPITNRQYCVIDITKSCSTTKTSAPIAGPANVPLPPSPAKDTRLGEWVQRGRSGAGNPGGAGGVPPADAAIDARDHKGGKP